MDTSRQETAQRGFGGYLSSTKGVLVWPDILGLRPAFRQMGKRLAESGYAVLVGNPFYRAKKAPVVRPGASCADHATRDIVMPLAKSLNATTHVTAAGIRRVSR